MITRPLLAVFIVLTLICGGIAIYYNRVFRRPASGARRNQDTTGSRAGSPQRAAVGAAVWPTVAADSSLGPEEGSQLSLFSDGRAPIWSPSSPSAVLSPHAVPSATISAPVPARCSNAYLV